MNYDIPSSIPSTDILKLHHSQVVDFLERHKESPNKVILEEIIKVTPEDTDWHPGLHEAVEMADAGEAPDEITKSVLFATYVAKFSQNMAISTDSRSIHLYSQHIGRKALELLQGLMLAAMLMNPRGIADALRRKQSASVPGTEAPVSGEVSPVGSGHELRHGGATDSSQLLQPSDSGSVHSADDGPAVSC